MCVTSNFDLEVIQGRQFAVERILLLIKNCITVRLGPGGPSRSREPGYARGVRRSARGEDAVRGPGSQAQGNGSDNIYLIHIKSTKTRLLPMLYRGDL